MGLRFGGSTPKHSGTSGWLPLERSSAPGPPVPLPSARPNVIPGSLPAGTQHLGKVPTDASAFLPAQVGGGAPPAARPLGAGIAAARALPRAHPHERPRGTASQVRATPRGVRSRPLARAAGPPAVNRGQAGPARLGSDPAARDREVGPSTPAPRLTCTRVVAAAGILSTLRAPRRETKPGQGGVRAPHLIPLSGPRARLPGRAARPNRPSLLPSGRQPAAAARAAAELARRLLTWNLQLPSMPSPRRSRVGFPRDAGPFLRVFPAAGGRGPRTLGRGPS